MLRHSLNDTRHKPAPRLAISGGDAARTGAPGSPAQTLPNPHDTAPVTDQGRLCISVEACRLDADNSAEQLHDVMQRTLSEFGL